MDVQVLHVVIQTHYVSEAVQNQQWFVWYRRLETVVCVQEVVKAESVTAQQVQVCTVVLEQADFVILTQDQTVEQYVISVQDNGTL